MALQSRFCDFPLYLLLAGLKRAKKRLPFGRFAPFAPPPSAPACRAFGPLIGRRFASPSLCRLSPALPCHASPPGQSISNRQVPIEVKRRASPPIRIDPRGFTA